MNGVNPSATSAISGAEIVYPVRDGKPMAETSDHVLVMVALIETLREYFRHRPDVFVIGNIFLFYEEGHPESRRSPDVMVVKGVEPGKERPSFKTWEERATPCVVIEITSRQTAEEDQGPKRELYERLGVREYFLFDPLHDYLERPLMGYRLIRGAYEPLPPAADGGLLSAELGLRLVPRGKNLVLIDFRTNQQLPSLSEAKDMLEEVRQRVTRVEEQARQSAEQVHQVADQARQAEEQARLAEEQARQAEEHVRQADEHARQVEQALQEERQRSAQLAEELARLRALQPPGDAGTGPAQP